MKYKGKIFLLSCIILLLIVGCAALRNNRKSNNYNAIVIIQKDYSNNTSELINMQGLINALPVTKEVSPQKTMIYRCDIGSVKEFIQNNIDYSDDILNKKSNVIPTCENSNIKLWFDCCIKKYPFIRNNSDKILIFNSAKGDTSQYVTDISGKNFPVFYKIEDIKQNINETKFTDKENINLIIFHYQFNIDYCDTIEQYMKNMDKNLISEIYIPNNKQKLFLTSPNHYEFKWKKLNGISNYELFLTNKQAQEIKFDIINIANNSNVKISGDTIIYHLDHDHLVKSISQFKSKVIEWKDAQDLLYKEHWSLKIRGKACEKYYAQYSNPKEGLLFICEFEEE